MEAPAASTITAILARNGQPLGAFGGGRPAWIRFEHAAPNDLWQMDFKGHVGLADGGRLHPLTVLDDHSRYALALRACADQQTQTVREALVEAFAAMDCRAPSSPTMARRGAMGPARPSRRWACFSSTRACASPIPGLITPKPWARTSASTEP